MSDPNDLIERISRFVKQQRELYGDFSTNLSSTKTEEHKNEADQSGNPEEQVSESEKKETETSEPAAITVKKEPPQAQLMETPEDRIKACNTLEELRALCEHADALKTDLPNTNLVFGVGNHNADLMIVGEAPGENEDKQGEPFVGRAGQLLDKIMEAINFQRSDIYIANILKHRPPNNRNPLPEERERSLPYLLRQIELIDPKIILCVGKVSGTTLLDKDTTLGSLRQKIHEFHGRELMVTYHPAALLRNPNWKRPTWEDVQMLRKRYDELGGKP